MSYRTIKRLIGETSLERKCRFLFGAGLVILITASFYLYGRLTADLVYEQNRIAGRLLIARVLLEKHWLWVQKDVETKRLFENLVLDLKPPGLKDYNWLLFSANLSEDKRPADNEAYEALAKLQSDSELNEVTRLAHSKGEYRYFGAVRASQSCRECHYHQEAEVGDLIGMARISFPLDSTKRALAWNNATLLATGIGTAFLAMVGAYVIVRYVVVKPVLHLVDVSNKIAQGNLGQRADIRSGDEFEELSQAFNRMVRHLTAIQEELSNVNQDLDQRLDELAKANFLLFQANSLKSEFLATMSHELKTPLNSILGFSDVLVEAKNLDERQIRYVRNILTSGKNLLALINDILDLAKIEAGKMELHLTELSFSDLVEQLVMSLQPIAEKKNIDLTFELDQSIPLLRQDPGKLRQILLNLLSNALKFTPEGGRIVVRGALVAGEKLAIDVIDTGVGIALEEQDRIFEKFRQGNVTNGNRDPMAREHEGTGLGLSIVKELTRLLEGEVLLESELGKGSKFTIIIPIEMQARLTLNESAVPGVPDWLSPNTEQGGWIRQSKPTAKNTG